MRLATIQLHDSQPTCEEIRDSYPDLWRAVEAAAPIAAWNDLLELLKAERARTRVAMLRAISGAMTDALEKEERR